MAGPGTGETEAIGARVCSQLSRGVPPDEVIVVSFTTQAAAEVLTADAAGLSVLGRDAPLRGRAEGEPLVLVPDGDSGAG